MRDMENARKWHREWISKRRTDWFSENGPCVNCGSWEQLELDHIYPKDKVSHSIWSWSKERRDIELSKCQILCNSCHKQKTYKDMNYGQHNVSGYDRGCRCSICTEEHRLKRQRLRIKARVIIICPCGQAKSKDPRMVLNPVLGKFCSVKCSKKIW